MSAVSHALMRTGKFKCYDNARERQISCSRCMTGGDYDSFFLFAVHDGCQQKQALKAFKQYTGIGLFIPP